MDCAGDFEWELSKENVTRLHRGRSVALLNKVLCARNSSDFLLRRQQIRQQFELKLSSMETSFAKLRLYIRYLRWVEQTYPSVTRSPDLENLLYRCVRDCSGISGVNNDEDFVEMWIRLTEYCEQPAELFELVFRQGIGTMCAKFYTSWSELLESQHQYAQAAVVYVHGLRAGAQPLFRLEDHAESFAARWRAQIEELDSSVNETFSNTVEFNACGSVRQSMAALRLVGNESGTGIRAPVLRSRETWDENQSGLHQSTNVPSGGLPGQPKVVNLPHKHTYFQDSGPTLLHTLAPLHSSVDATVRPLGQPSQWQKENMHNPVPWASERLPTVAAKRTPVASPTWKVYSELPNDEVPLHAKESVSNENMIRAPIMKRKGLKIVHSECASECLSKSGVPCRLLSTYTGLMRTERSSLQSSSPDQSITLLHLNLPSLPVGELPKNADFSCSLNLLYGGAEEMCWEMHRALYWNKRTQSPIFTSTRYVSSDWDEEEKKVLEEIETIVQQSNQPPPEQKPNSMLSSSRLPLIKTLETIALHGRAIK